MSVISTKCKLSNPSYENNINYYIDEDTVIPEAILPDDKRMNWYRSDKEVEKRGGLGLQKMQTSERGKARTKNPDFADLDCADQYLSPKEQFK